MEVTKRKNKEPGSDWDLGLRLWSPSRNKGGGDLYRLMREAQPGDVVIHAVQDNWEGGPKESRIAGWSVVKEACREVTEEPPRAGEWAGRGSYYMVQLTGFNEVEHPTPLGDFFDTNADELAGIKEQYSEAVMFYGKGRHGVPWMIAQGKYFSEVPPELEILLLGRGIKATRA